MSPLETLILSGGTLIGAGVPEVIETRDPVLWPFSSSSLWNTPVGDGRSLGAPAWRNGIVGGTLVTGSLAWQFRSWVSPYSGLLEKAAATVNFAAYSTPINRGKASDPPLTVRPVEGGTWGPRSTVRDSVGNLPQDVVVPHAPENVVLAGDMAPSLTRVNYAGSGTTGGAISFTNVQTGASPWEPDGFMSLIDETTGDVVEAYKACWWPTGGGGVANPSSRILIARRGVINRYSLRGDGWTTPSGRASRLGFVTGLIRTWEIEKAATDPQNAIRHALAIALHASQMLRPSTDTGTHPAKTSGMSGYQWPARARDGHAENVYRGLIRMGTQFVLDPTWDFEADTSIPNEGLALCYALRDYGCYVSDISNGLTFYAEQGSPATATNRMRATLQTHIMERMLPVLNNSADNVGGPGTRVRPPAPPLALA